MSVDLLIETALSGELGTVTLVRLLEAAPNVQTLPHFTVAFPRSTSGWISLTCLVPACLFEDKPNIANPEDNIYETKNLEEEGTEVSFLFDPFVCFSAQLDD